MKAGVLLDANGLQPSSKGARIKYSAGKRAVMTGLSPRRRSSLPAIRSFG